MRPSEKPPGSGGSCRVRHVGDDRDSAGAREVSSSNVRHLAGPMHGLGDLHAQPTSWSDGAQSAVAGARRHTRGGAVAGGAVGGTARRPRRMPATTSRSGWACPRRATPMTRAWISLVGWAGACSATGPGVGEGIRPVRELKSAEASPATVGLRRAAPPWPWQLTHPVPKSCSPMATRSSGRRHRGSSPFSPGPRGGRGRRLGLGWLPERHPDGGDGDRTPRGAPVASSPWVDRGEHEDPHRVDEVPVSSP